MSVTAARVFLLVTGAVGVVGIAWAAAAWMLQGPWASGSALPGALGVVGLVGFIALLPLCLRFGEVTVGGGAVRIRGVLSSTRIPLAGVDEVVVLRSLVLPARVPAAAVARFVLRRGGQTVAAFTPRDDRALARELVQQGFDPVVESAPLSAGAAQRRYPGSVGGAERVLGPVLWAIFGIVIVATLPVIWSTAS